MWHFLALESSCDDTSAAVLRAESGAEMAEILAVSVQSQNEVHEKFGGVVPELASRAHLQNLIPCIKKALTESNISLDSIDAFFATDRPGLIGSLIVGHTAAKTFSMIYKKPFISVNHIHGHIMSVFIENKPQFPFLCLVASGGHTSLFLVKNYDEFDSVGVTLDDAVGEAFDKGAKLLGLGFPGGPEIDRLGRIGNADAFAFGKVKTADFNFSFSGLKSDFVRTVQKISQVDGRISEEKRADLAASYQKSLLNHLFEKLDATAKNFNISQLAVVGGVASNSELRRRLNESQIFKSVYFPSLKFCTDNAAMIGMQGYRKFIKQELSSLESDIGSTSRPAKNKILRAL